MPTDERISDLLNFAVDQKPLEFQQTVNDILQDRIAAAVDAHKIEMSKTIFNGPPEEEPVDDADLENEDPVEPGGEEPDDEQDA